MPGFAVTGSAEGTQKDNRAEYRRKHRWRITQASKGGMEPRDFLELKSASRPSFSLNETEVHHDQEVAYFAGKQTWEPIVITFYDQVTNGSGIAEKLYAWVKSVADIDAANVFLPTAYKGDVTLVSTSNTGTPDETWTLKGCWPSKSNWTDLDYSNPEIQLVEITLRFDRAIQS